MRGWQGRWFGRRSRNIQLRRKHLATITWLNPHPGDDLDYIVGLDALVKQSVRSESHSQSGLVGARNYRRVGDRDSGARLVVVSSPRPHGAPRG